MNQRTPLGRSSSPGDLKTRGNGVGTLARLVRVLPAKTLLRDVCSIGLVADVVSRSGTVGLAKGVTTSNQGDSLLVVHGHTAECSADVVSSSNGVWDAIGTLRVDVNQTHVSGRKRVLKILLVGSLAFDLALVTVDDTTLSQTSLSVGVTDIVAEPCGFSSPVYGLVCFPLVGAATSETEGLDAHVLEGNCEMVSTLSFRSCCGVEIATHHCR
jgi:hypothetical protein